MLERSSNDYILLYCKYDRFFCRRNYLELLNTLIIRKIDVDIAVKALVQEELSEVEKIIRFGSPQAQQYQLSQKNVYVSEILDEAKNRLIDN